MLTSSFSSEFMEELSLSQEESMMSEGDICYLRDRSNILLDFFDLASLLALELESSSSKFFDYFPLDFLIFGDGFSVESSFSAWEGGGIILYKISRKLRV